MINNYVDGMKEIKADENLKQKIIYSIKESKNIEAPIAFRFKKIAAVAAIACTFIIIIIFGLHPFSNLVSTKQAPANNSVIASSLAITAYASDGTSQNMKPNVDILIGKYSLAMSSVPGFPFKVTCAKSNTIKITATSGEFISWTPSNGKIEYRGKSLEIKSGSTIYWSPVAHGNDTVAENCKISIKANNKTSATFESSIQINCDNYSYTARLIK